MDPLYVDCSRFEDRVLKRPRDYFKRARRRYSLDGVNLQHHSEEQNFAHMEEFADFVERKDMNNFKMPEMTDSRRELQELEEELAEQKK